MVMGRDFSLFDDFELQGYWWLPDRPGRKIPGLLSRKGQEITLNLLGDLLDIPLSERGVVKQPPRPPIILGYVEGKGSCTLYRTMEAGATFHTSDNFRST